MPKGLNMWISTEIRDLFNINESPIIYKVHGILGEKLEFLHDELFKRIKDAI